MSPLNSHLFLWGFCGGIVGIVLSVRSLLWKWHQRRVRKLVDQIDRECNRLGWKGQCSLGTFGIQSPEELNEIGALKGILYQMKRGRGCGGVKV